MFTMTNTKKLLILLFVGLLTIAWQSRPGGLIGEPVFVLTENGIIESTITGRAMDVVNLVEGTTYTVPSGKTLILTDYTVTDVAISEINAGDELVLRPRIRVDTVDVWGTGYHSDYREGGFTSVSALTYAFSTGIKCEADTDVTLHANPSAVGQSWPTTPVMFATGFLTVNP
jgi:hypothetical protein